MALKWGIVSAGKISTDFVQALQILPEENHKIVAVAARDGTMAEAFAQLYNIPTFYEGYLSLAEDKDIDVVYVATINTQHYNVCKMMLERGKHVLCEKPLTMNERQTKELIEMSKRKGLFLLEAVWSRFFPAYKKLAQVLEDGIIGDVLYCNVTFGVPMQDKLRIATKRLGGGAILDLGVYLLQFVQFVFRNLKPIKISAQGYLNKDGVDHTTNTMLLYPNTKSALVSCSTKIKLPNEAIVVGTKGTIKVPMFWSPTKLILPNETLKFDVPKLPLHPNPEKPKGGLSYEAEEVYRCVKGGLLESPLMPHTESLELAQLMDKLRQDVGVIFDDDI